MTQDSPLSSFIEILRQQSQGDFCGVMESARARERIRVRRSLVKPTDYANPSQPIYGEMSFRSQSGEKLGQLDPRIDQAVKQVDQEIHHEIGDREDQDQNLGELIVTRRDRLDQQVADARKGKNGFGDH